MLPHTSDVPPPGQLTNVFVGIRPDPRSAGNIHARGVKLTADISLKGAMRPTDILHSSLVPIGAAPGRMPFELLRRIDAAMERLKFSAFEVGFDQAMSFDTHGVKAPFVLTNERGARKLAELRQDVVDVLRSAGMKVPALKSFRPHMTLAYAQTRHAKMNVPPIFWRVQEIQLIESWIGKTKYVELGRWSLEPPASQLAYAA